MSRRTGTDEYGDWMVVKRKHKPKDNRGSSCKSPSDAMGKSEDIFRPKWPNNHKILTI